MNAQKLESLDINIEIKLIDIIEKSK